MCFHLGKQVWDQCPYFSLNTFHMTHKHFHEIWLFLAYLRIKKCVSDCFFVCVKSFFYSCVCFSIHFLYVLRCKKGRRALIYE